jgi:hypothetical protein
MITAHLLVTVRKPDETRLGQFSLPNVVLRVPVNAVPAKQELWAVFFLTSDAPLPEMEVRITAAPAGSPGKVLSSSELRLQGGGDVTFGIVHWRKFPIDATGPYRFSLHMKDRQTGNWIEPPASFWIVHAVLSDDMAKQ